MAKLVPTALETVLAQTRLQDVPDVDEIAEKMRVEIAANCAKSLL